MDKAHPRVCGENPETGEVKERLVGSSPRVRGKLPGWGANGGRGGLIPACAGKTT